MDQPLTARISKGTLRSQLLTRRSQVWIALITIAFATALGLAISAVLPSNVAVYVPPSLAALAIGLVFSALLYRRVGENVIGELGFIYVWFILAYTLVPAAGFMLAGIDAAGPIASLLPDSGGLVTHLWRHVLFLVGVAGGYLLLRGREIVPVEHHLPGTKRDGRAIVVVTLVLGISIAATILLSAPVHSYWEHYTRYDHLSWLPRKFVSLSIRLSLGLYCVLLVFLFRSYSTYKYIIPIVVAAICVHEITYSYGARIQALIVLLQAGCLYHYMVRKISLRTAIFAGLVLAAVFSAVELVRQEAGDVALARNIVEEDGLRPATEFTSVFFPSYHLYEERANGALPTAEWPMFFNDFISLFTFGDFTRWNPMSWYTRNYYPEIDVPPFTLGPIADSAIWGGEMDLLIRAIVNGIFFAWIMRWFAKHRRQWWGMATFAYCYATSVLTLKYSVFLDLSLIEKNLIPTMLLVYVARVIQWDRRQVPAAAAAGMSAN